ncbi:hypothetical protein KIN20_025121 [Parelaphostrongylus tenuis]|uniref:Uncharacterized protein n=1 Tax=Parelaphostrongylus tenuis TaxID=148309 RepID=A0AAD5NBN4_PARTN|nr:hypothetical protein KIN20_025121 [Parelaphostrongylus tenuis]
MNNVGEATRICCPSSCVLPSFSIDCASVKLLKGESLDDLIEYYGPSSVDAKRIRILRALNSGRPEDALDDAESILNDESASWRDLVLVAELNIASSKDATSLLVKSAKLNPRSSRVFFLLGRTLCRKNPPKARSCLERAVKIRPTNEEYVRALDDVYCEVGESVEQRLALLNGLCAYRKPLWLRKRLAELCKAKQDWDTVISELQHIIRESPDDIGSWAGLAEAYSSRGNLQSSVKAYERLLGISPESDYAICLIQVLMRMHNLDEAAKRCDQWRSNHRGNSVLKKAVDVLDAQVHLRLFDNSVGEERYEHLKMAFNLLDIVISERPRISLAYKLAADALFRASKFQDEFMLSVGIPSSWSISCRLSAIRSTVMFYSVALHLNQENPWAWNDLAVALLYSSHLNKSSEDAVKALECLRKALGLCKCSQMRSHFWTLIAEAERLSTVEEARNNASSSAALQQHYLVRALQLNKANDEAWLRLALLYYTNGAMDKSHMAIETALKHNPQLAEAWCAWALKADLEGIIDESMDLFRHSISIKPIASAVMKYTAYLCQTMESSRFDPATVMIDFNKVLQLRDGIEAKDKDLLLHMGWLQWISSAKSAIESRPSCCQSCGALKNLGLLCAFSTEELFTILKEEQPLYKNLFEQLTAPNAEELQELYNAHSKLISVPLVVAAIIRFELPISDQAVTVLHDVLPRHELIDVFPTVMPEEMDNGLKYVEQDGEEPFRYSHYVAKPLWEVLRKCRDQLQSDE